MAGLEAREHGPQAPLVGLFRGPMIDRGPYALIGVAAFALKHNLDRFIASAIFHRPWGIFNYLAPLGSAARLGALPPEDAAFLATMLLVSLPFVFLGLVLTVRRLRSAGLPVWLVSLFFIPVFNLLFFALLSVIPAWLRAGDETAEDSAGGRWGRPLRARRVRPWFDRLIPEGPIGSAAIAIALVLPVGAGLALLAASVLAAYGWGLFVALPFCLGLASVLLYGYHQPRSYVDCIAVAWLSILLVSLVLAALAVEGIVCIGMAAPIAIVLGFAGGTIGYMIQSHRGSRSQAPEVLGALLVLLPAFMGIEHALSPAPPVFEVRTAIEIDAPPEAVWRQVVAFTEIPEPEEWLFRMGVAYPVRAEIHGQGVGAERHCVFSTGEFIEPIEVWDPPRLLRFSVTSNPPPMHEWTPSIAGSSRRTCMASWSRAAGSSCYSPFPAGGLVWRGRPGIVTRCGPPPIGESGRTSSFIGFICACFGISSGPPRAHLEQAFTFWS